MCGPFFISVYFLFVVGIANSAPPKGLNVIKPVPYEMPENAGKKHFNQARIVNGTQVPDDGKYPWMAYIGDVGCTGTIISDRYILTAGHCLVYCPTQQPCRWYRAQELYVVVGSSNIGSQYAQYLPIRRLTPHQNYATTPDGGATNDIALIELTQPLALDYYVWPINLSGRQWSASTGQNLVIAGWGDTTASRPPQYPYNMYEGRAKVVQNNACAQKFTQSYNSTRNICIGSVGGSFPSWGDSGGPAFTYIRDTAQQWEYWAEIGLTSFSADPPQASIPTAYTRISTYCSWIYANTYQQVACVY